MLPLLALLLFAAPPQTGDATLPPASAHPSVTAIGYGFQIYRCTPQRDNTFKWVFETPEATLLDPQTHQTVGKHSAGPTWHWNDGSEITGKLLQTTPAANPSNLPSLLLEAHSTGGPGQLADIAFVRRSDTQAGVPPSPTCTARQNTDTIRVPYKATYTFYTAK